MIWSSKPRSEIWNDGGPFEDFLGSDAAPPIARRHLCSGGGKSGNTTQSQASTAGPPAWISGALQNLYGQAQGVAAQPFQQYGGQFVAPVNAQQTTGISGINSAAGTYAPYGAAATSALTPYYGAATGTLSQGLGAGQALTMQGAQPVSAANINQYMSPYIQNVVQATENQQNLQNQQQQSQLQGNAISAGAFGGDRSGVAASNLAYQQNLANQPVIANLYNQGYSTALGAAQQQQQTSLSAGNQLYNQGLGGSQQYQNLGTGLSQNLSGLGTTAQTNQLTAANAQLGAGTLQQQTQQAQDTALYNQFLQQQAYPFQTTQFLANILEGVAPNAGSTTTSTGVATSPMSFFRRGGRVGFANGGLSANDNDIASLLAAHAQMYPALAGSGSAGPYGLALSASGGHGQPIQPHTMQMQPLQKSGGLGSDIQGLNQAVSFGENLGKLYGAGKGAIIGTPAGKDPKTQPATGGLAGYGGVWGASDPTSANGGLGGGNVIPFPNPMNAPTLPDGTPISDDIFNRGGRVGFANGGLPYADQISDPIVPNDVADPMRPNETLKPAPMGGLSSGSMSSGAGKGLQALGQVASIASMFLAKGGRVHKDGGGGLSGDPIDLTNGVTPVAAIDPDVLERSRKAIASIEPDKRGYGTVGVATEGDRPYGLYGVMGKNVPQWTKAALGKEMTPDEFLKDPEAQDKTFNHRFGQHLAQYGNPQDAASAWFSGKPQAQAGNAKDILGTSVPDYISRFNKAYGADPAAAPVGVGAGLGVDPNAGVASLATQPSWWDKQSGGLSGTERAIISVLSGIGGMASSPSRFLGSAIAQGLGAGAGTYGNLAQKGMSLDIAQQQANTAQTAKGLEVAKFRQSQYEPRIDPATGQTVYFDKLSGRSLTPEQYREAMGGVFSMLPGTTGATLAHSTVAPSGAPVGGIPAPKPLTPQITQNAPPKPVVHTLPDGTPITDEPQGTPSAAPAVAASPVDKETNPAYLFSEANRLNDLAQKADAQGSKDQAAGFRVQAEQFTKRATEAGAVAEKAKMLPAAQGEALKENYKAQQKVRDEALTEARNASQSLQQAQAMKDLYFDPKTGKPNISGGPAGEHITRFAALAKQAGFSNEFVKAWTGTDPNDAQALQKLTTIMGSEIARQELAGSPVRVQEFNRFLAMTPSDQLLPEAFKWIIDKTIIPKAKAQMGAYESIADADPLKENIQKRLYEYGRDNPWYRPAPAAEQGATKPQITPEEARAELARRKAAQGH